MTVNPADLLLDLANGIAPDSKHVTVNFGPILPKSAGFSMTRRSKDGLNETIRENSTSNHSKEEKSSIWGAKESIIEENEDDSNSELDDASVDSDKNNIFSPELKMIKDEDIEPKVLMSSKSSYFRGWI